ncbi:MAG: beta-ketoacyl synthase N-terminal-like domain-containing protein [Pseudomonadota bacterium]|nr:beta-ketoacyl synthase N-terminal-like domain-containing protein [Pseudomonadota bacterium]
MSRTAPNVESVRSDRRPAPAHTPDPSAAPARAPIAIVGIAGTFARSRDISEYWNNILHEVDCITDVPPSHWAVEDYYDPDPNAPDKTYSKRGGFLPEHDFNPLEFGLPPNILELTDVAQLLALVVASRALSDAGYGEANPLAQRTGVVLGVSALGLVGALSARLQYPIWRRVLKSRAVPEPEIDAIVETIQRAYIEWREDSFPGYLSNVVPGRIANRLNLGGINCSVDAACASSMASMQFAVHELRSHSCDMMLAGGVDTNNTPMSFVSFSKTPAFTAHDHMRPFDAASDGMLIGEGVGVLVLRRLEDAERDGQRVYAVIRGVGASSDGRFSSVYAPRQEGQELALRRAYEEAGVSPSSVGLVEAHGTGTPSGDSTELAALQAVFAGGAGTSIALGSVKSQIGHTKVAAGAASLIKAALALHEKVLPPTINVAVPHPAIRAPFYVNTRTRPWFATAPRRAGVSSFGFGGTNFHVILEEHRPAKSDAPRTQPTPFALFLHAPGTPALAELCARVANELESDAGARRFRELVEESKTAAIPTDAARIGLLARTREEARERLEEAAAALSRPSGASATPAGFHFRERAMDTSGRLAVLFPGQGSQSVDMGASLCANFPPIHEAFAQMDEARATHGLPRISDVVFPPPVFGKVGQDAQAQTLRATNHAQAAIGALNLGLFALLRRCGCTPDYLAGHSLGELTALHAGGALGERDYLSLLVARGEAMAEPPPSGTDPGTLLAVGGDTAMLEAFLQDRPGVSIANRNSRSQLVIAGSQDELSTLKAELAALGVTATLLPVSGAFHSHRVAHAQAPFARALEGVPLVVPRIPTYSNTTGAPYPSLPSSEDAVRRLLAEQLVRPVEFQRQIEAIHDAGGRIFVECGPGRVLTGLVGNILSDRPHLAIALNRTKADDDESLRDAYVRLRVAGVALTDLDPWQSLPDASAKKRGLVVRLSGTSYKSEATQLAFEEALTRAPEVAMADGETRSNLVMPVPSRGDTTAQAHLRYLENLADCSSQYFELTQQLYALATNPACSPGALASFERAVSSYHELHLTAQHVHAQFLGQRIEASPRVPTRSFDSPPIPVRGPPPIERAPEPAAPPRVLTAPIESPRGAPRGAPTPAAPSPVPSAASPRPGLPAASPPRPEAKAAPPSPAPRAAAPPPPASAQRADDIAAILMSVISEKTGYPLDTLEVTMDVDADLGIDSLKRVEIMAALEGRLFKNLSGIDFSSFSTKRTISDIANFLAEVG